MDKKPIISSYQLLLMAVGSALVFPYTFLPILDTGPANQDAWIVLIISLVYILAINAPMLFLTNKFRGMNVSETTETILGKYLGKAAALLFVAFFLYCYTACMLITAVFINLFIFPSTPAWALYLYMIFPASFAAYKGAGTIGRIATFIVPFITITVVLFFLLGLDKMDWHVLQPVLADSTFGQLNLGAFLTGARYSEILIFFVFSCFLWKDASINKTYASALGVFAVCFLLILIPTITVLGVELAKHEWNPYFAFTRQVEAFGFLERAQSLNTLGWFPASILKLAMYNFMGSYVLSGVVKAKSHKYFVFPLSIVSFIVCLLPTVNKTTTVDFLRSDNFFPYTVLPVTFVIPLIMVAVYTLRRKKIDQTLRQMQKARLRTGPPKNDSKKA